MSETPTLKLEAQNASPEQVSENELEMINLFVFAQVVAENMPDSEMDASQVLLGMIMMMGSESGINSLTNMQIAITYAESAISTVIKHEGTFKAHLNDARREFAQGFSRNVEAEEAQTNEEDFSALGDSEHNIVDIARREEIVASAMDAAKGGRAKDVILLIIKNPKGFSDELVVDIARQIRAAGGFKNLDNLLLFFGTDAISTHAKALVLHDALRDHSSQSFPQFPESLKGMILSVPVVNMKEGEVNTSALAA